MHARWANSTHCYSPANKGQPPSRFTTNAAPGTPEAALSCCWKGVLQRSESDLDGLGLAVANDLDGGIRASSGRTYLCG